MDPYDAVAAYYDLEHADFADDLVFYGNLVASGPVLEVGVGTGRVMSFLLDAGHAVWGIDPSAAMLDRARVRVGDRDHARLIQGSLLDLSLDQRFGTVLFPLNVLWHFETPGAQRAALRTAHHYLRTGAMVILDCSNPLSLADRGASGQVRERFRRSTAGSSITGYSAAWDDEANQLLTLHLKYEEISTDGAIRYSTSELDLRYLYRSELELLLIATGFVELRFFGSYELDEYESASPNLIAVAHKSA